MKILFITLIVLLTINLSYGQTNYYVNNSLGNDALGNGSSPGASAWKTIEYAVNNVSNPSVDPIIINISGGIYNLFNDQIDIDRNFANLTLIGDGSDNTFIQSAVDTTLSTSRVVRIYSGNNVSIKNLTVRYGRILVPGESGGGILNSGGTLTLDYCKITENLNGSAVDGYGGGIANLQGSLTINNSTISYNTGADSGQGGGIGSKNGILNIYNSTISYNSTPYSGGGIAVLSDGANAIFNMENSTVYENIAYHFGGIRVTVFGPQPSIFDITTNINSCTIFNNSAVDFYGGIGLSSPSNFNIKNSIVAGNAAGLNPLSDNFKNNLQGSSGIQISITSGGYNIIETVSYVTINGEQNNGIGLDPNLLPLDDNNSNNGTQTCAISENSPAKDKIPGTFGNGAPLFDQRGFQRIGDYEIGAFELSNINDVAFGNESLPKLFKLEQNYPNPFNPTTKINYSVPFDSKVTISIYSITGEFVTELVNANVSSGSYSAELNGNNLASGIYLYKMAAGDPSLGSGRSFVQTRKMILIK